MSVVDGQGPMDAESLRLVEDARREKNWKRWGPYLSERQWGTVREDYSADGNVWNYFPHDHARSRAYRWGEDGLLGISDRQGRLSFALALWNGRDPILKERLFGLSGPEGNHGEDVKECYFYLESTPTHSYMRALYKYPQREYPYRFLVEDNGRRGKAAPELELADTGIFDEDRYFDVFAEYAKASPNDVLIRIRVANRGTDDAVLHLLPTLWFRNSWSWGRTGEGYWPKPRLERAGEEAIRARHASLGDFLLAVNGGPDGERPEIFFTDNETNARRLYGLDSGAHVKDAFHEYVVRRRTEALNPDGVGTKAAAYYQQQLFERPGCVPALGYEDFDLSPADLAELGARGLETLFEEKEAKIPPSLSPFLRERLLAIEDWREGCRGGAEAVDLFRRASRRAASAGIYPMSEVLALVAAKRWREADSLFLSIYSAWQDDPRFPAISASIGVARGDLEDAEKWLSSSAEVVPRRLKHPLLRKLWSGDIDPRLISELEREFPSEWPDLVRTALSAELRFYVLLWQSRYQDARAYAGRMAALFQRMELPTSRWRERQGDAAFYDGDYLEARARYEESLARSESSDDIVLKLSDTHFKLGNFDLERLYREKIYGSLRSEVNGAARTSRSATRRWPNSQHQRPKLEHKLVISRSYSLRGE